MNTQHTPNDIVVVVRLPVDLRDALKIRAQQEDRSVAALLRVAARSYLGGDHRPDRAT